MARSGLLWQELDHQLSMVVPHERQSRVHGLALAVTGLLLSGQASVPRLAAAVPTGAVTTDQERDLHLSRFRALFRN